jgi:hypothetical protein
MKSPVPAFVRNLVSPPYTDEKAKLVGKVFSFASLYNQSDAVFLITALATVLIAAVCFYNYST